MLSALKVVGFIVFDPFFPLFEPVSIVPDSNYRNGVLPAPMTQ
ncbi:hypothetical protein METHB2_120022 [Candidatus Methylobacter favarea]|uniref:Uncharacterized protein n=1 Tax=Candidatus Methylobacter favarea TaxID=2707345 RepID=A0A8S0WYN6_9GAMM|nr:hypothetical protein METHB2_120022 [Candidatus Methylobacter favarea]